MPFVETKSSFRPCNNIDPTSLSTSRSARIASFEAEDTATPSQTQNRSQYAQEVASLGLHDFYVRDRVERATRKDGIPDNMHRWLEEVLGPQYKLWKESIVRGGTMTGEPGNQLKENLRILLQQADEIVATSLDQIAESSAITLLDQRIREVLPNLEINELQRSLIWKHGKAKAFEAAIKALHNRVARHRPQDNEKVPEEEQLVWVTRALRLLYDFVPRRQQADCVRHLLFERSDLILIAKTSFGKSVVMQSYPFLSGRTALIILPLDQIGKEQANRLEAIHGRPLALNADRRSKLSKDELHQLQTSDFTHIMISPEAATSAWFRDIAKMPVFQQRIGLVCIDEFHLVEQWGKRFRRDYARIRFLRSLLPSHTRWFACSATLDAITLCEARFGAGFRQSVRVVRTPFDRPEICLRVACIPKDTIHTFDALFHLVHLAFDRERKTKTPELIAKTVVFIDNRSHCAAACQAVRGYLQKMSSGKYSVEELNQIFRVYHSKVVPSIQKEILDEFRKAGEESRIRIVFATESLGMGIDLDDIVNIIQYRFPQNKHVAVLMQRAGRAARKAGSSGCFTLMVESSQYGSKETCVEAPKQATDAAECASQAIAQYRAVATKIQARPQTGIENQILLSVSQRQAKDAQDNARNQEKDNVNTAVLHAFAKTSGCRRHVLTEFFRELELSETEEFVGQNDRCCDNCQPGLRLVVQRDDQTGSEYAHEQKIYWPLINAYLQEWEHLRAQLMWTYTTFPALPGSWFPHSFLLDLAKDLSRSRVASRRFTSRAVIQQVVRDKCAGGSPFFDPTTGPRPLRKEDDTEALWTFAKDLLSKAEDAINERRLLRLIARTNDEDVLETEGSLLVEFDEGVRSRPKRSRDVVIFEDVSIVSSQPVQKRPRQQSPTPVLKEVPVNVSVTLGPTFDKVVKSPQRESDQGRVNSRGREIRLPKRFSATQ